MVKNCITCGKEFSCKPSEHRRGRKYCSGGLSTCWSQTPIFHQIRHKEIVRVKAKELRDLSVEELREREKELNREFFNLRIQKATGQLGNTAMMGKVKKDLARVKTVLREVEIQDDVK